MLVGLNNIIIHQRFHLYWNCPVCGYHYSQENDDGYESIEELNKNLKDILDQDWTCPDCEKRGGK